MKVGDRVKILRQNLIDEIPVGTVCKVAHFGIAIEELIHVRAPDGTLDAKWPHEIQLVQTPAQQALDNLRRRLDARAREIERMRS